MTLAITIVLVTVPFIEVMFGTRTAIWGDVRAYITRDLETWANIRHGESPFWRNSVFSGFNALGAGQSATFYLPNILFAWLKPVVAFRWWFFLHLWMMAAGWHTWSWRRWRSPVGAVVSALSAVLTGFFVLHSMFLPYVAGLAYLPWMFLTADLIMERPRPIHSALLAAFVGAFSVLGLPMFLWLTLIPFGIVSLVQLLKPGTTLRSWIVLGSGLVLGVALGALQLIPQSVFSTGSYRQRLDHAGAFQLSAQYRHLLTTIAPSIMGGTNNWLIWKSPWLGGDLHHEVTGYLGVTFVGLALVGAWELRRNNFARAMIGVAVLGLVSALGGRTPVGLFMYRFLPYANHFRGWNRNQLWTTIAVSILAGAGARTLTKQPGRVAFRLILGASVLLSTLLLLPTVTDLGGAFVKGREGTLALVMPGLLLLALGCAALVSDRRRTIGLVLVVAVCFIDGAFFTISGQWRGEALSPSTAATAFRVSDGSIIPTSDAPGGIDRWVSDIADASKFWTKVEGRSGRAVNGYDPLIQVDYAKSVGDMAYNGYLRTSRFWTGGWLPDILRTTTLVVSSYSSLPSSAWRYRSESEFGKVFDYSPRLAEAYLVGAVDISTLDRIRSGILDPSTPLLSFAYVDLSTMKRSELASFSMLSSPGVSGVVTSGAMDDGGFGEWRVAASRPSLFVASYAWMKGWTASVDGRTAPVTRANAVVLGVPVPAGVHTVRLRFTPPGWRSGRDISVAAAFVLLLVLLIDTRRFARRFPRLGAWARGSSDVDREPTELSA
jgi:hypothetical protein